MEETPSETMTTTSTDLQHDEPQIEIPPILVCVFGLPMVAVILYFMVWFTRRDLKRAQEAEAEVEPEEDLEPADNASSTTEDES